MNLPWGYLTTLVLTELWTLAALVPSVRPRPLVTLGFRLGLTMNELPFVASPGSRPPRSWRSSKAT